MEYDSYLLILTTSIISFYYIDNYMNNRLNKITEQINYYKNSTEILCVKIDNLEKNINHLERLKFKILEKNLVIQENRAWDILSNSTSEEEEEDEEEEEY